MIVSKIVTITIELIVTTYTNYNTYVIAIKIIAKFISNSEISQVIRGSI